MKSKITGLIFAGVLGSCALTAQAVEIERLPGSTDLSDAGFWVGGAVPGSGDIGVFSGGTVPDTNSVAYAGANVYFGGYKVTDIHAPVSFGMITYLNNSFGIIASNTLADVSFSHIRNNYGSWSISVASNSTVRCYQINSSKNTYTLPISGGGTMLVNGWITGDSTRMFFNVTGAGTTIGGNGSWKASLVNITYGMQIGAGCYIAPGDNGVGTMKIDGAGGATALYLADGSGLKLELGSGGTFNLPSDNSDKLLLANMGAGDVVFGGTTVINCLGTGSDGVFKLIDTDGDTNTWSGLTLSGQEITGGLVVTNVSGGVDYSLILGDGSTGDNGDIYLVVGNVAPPYDPASVVWSAGTGDWDIDTSLNWNSGTSVYYEEGGIGDYVTFDDTAAGPWPIDITLNTNVYPSAVTVSATNDYTFSGTGSILGENTIVTKSGSGTFTMNLASSYGGGTTIEGGSVVLNAQSAKLGTGTVVLTNNTLLTLYRGDASDNSTYPVFANELNIPAGQTGTVYSFPRGTWSGALTGSGTLNLRVNYVRGEITGNWSAFSGQLNVTSRTGYDEFRVALGGGGSGLQLASGKLDLADGVLMYQSVNPPSGTGTVTVHNIGELSGSAGARIAGNPVSGRFANWTVGALGTDSTYAGIIQNSAGASRLTKVGSGMLTLSGTNTYTGATTVNAGTLYISGVIGATTNVAVVTVASGAAIGGGGAIGGNLTMNDGAWFAFNASDTLTVSNSLSFSTNITFGADDIVGIESNTVEATYTLIDGFTNTLSGIDTATYVVNGHSVKLQAGAGSLQLVVGTGLIPDINSISVSGGFATLYWDSGTYNVYTNSTLTNPAGWGLATSGTASATMPIGSQSQLFYRLGN